MQNNSEFIRDKNFIFEYFEMCQDKSNVIGSLLSTKTFDFKSVNINGNTMLQRAIEYKLKITPELLEVSDVNYKTVLRSQNPLTLALNKNYSID